MKAMKKSDQQELSDLTGDEWEIIGTSLPAKRRDRRNVLNAVMHMQRVGCPWASMPERYGDYRTVYKHCRRWALDGVWDTELELLASLGCLEDWRHTPDAGWLRSVLFDAARELRDNRRPARTISQATRDYLESFRPLQPGSVADPMALASDPTWRDFP